MIRSAFVLLMTSVLFSCGGDDDDKKYSFKDRDLSGKIGGSPWAYADGYSDISSGTASITLTLAQDEEGCSIGFAEGNQVFFDVPAETGLYLLKFDLSGSTDNQTVTLLEIDGFVNNIATEGAIEILSITETTITGRIDAHIDGDNTVNGNFAVTICPL